MGNIQLLEMLTTSFDVGQISANTVHAFFIFYGAEWEMEPGWGIDETIADAVRKLSASDAKVVSHCVRCWRLELEKGGFPTMEIDVSWSS